MQYQSKRKSYCNWRLLTSASLAVVIYNTVNTLRYFSSSLTLPCFWRIRSSSNSAYRELPTICFYLSLCSPLLSALSFSLSPPTLKKIRIQKERERRSRLYCVCSDGESKRGEKEKRSFAGSLDLALFLAGSLSLSFPLSFLVHLPSCHPNRWNVCRVKAVLRSLFTRFFSFYSVPSLLLVSCRWCSSFRLLWIISLSSCVSPVKLWSLSPLFLCAHGHSSRTVNEREKSNNRPSIECPHSLKLRKRTNTGFVTHLSDIYCRTRDTRGRSKFMFTVHTALHLHTTARRWRGRECSKWGNIWSPLGDTLVYIFIWLYNLTLNWTDSIWAS